MVRGRLGLSQADVCRLAGVNEVYCYYWESGFRNPNLANLKVLSEALCCTIDDLVNVPSDARLAAIRADYLERQAAQARAQADAAKAAEEVA